VGHRRAEPTAPARDANAAAALQVTSIWNDRVYLDVSLLADHHATAEA
jgi:hypothetical protein